MPIQVKVRTVVFKDEDGNPTDADFTIRTSLSHKGERAYMRAVTAEADMSEAIGPDGQPVPGYRPRVSISTIETIERVLLEDALVDLRNVLDRQGKEIKTWEEFLGFETHYVSQVVNVLQGIAADSVKKGAPNPNTSAPSVAP